MLDYYNVMDMLGDEEKQVQSTARQFLDSEAAPDIADYWERGEFPKHLVPKIGEMGYFGANLPSEYGSAGVNNVSYGLIMYELERIDSGLRSFASVQGALVMYPIYSYGSDEQRREYLPKLASGEMIGCFGLTEHEGGSDPGAMRTTARKDGESYVLNGSKMWITNGNIADVALVWAADDDGVVRGFLVPTDTPGFVANKIEHKMSMRASVTSELVMDECRVPASAMLPEVKGLRGPLSCLTQARYGITWGVLGATEAVYQDALEFSQSRETFGHPIASRQLVQDKLVNMVSDHTRGLLLSWRLAVLKDQGKMGFSQVSLAKRDAARSAREILGGSGIVLGHPSIRHMLNLETVDTYEGTHDIHTLILGRDLTGHNALG
ncbi:MAG: acyl-CoA dehydrogenase family protein [Dehalococcoidia bacterium]|nr:acyl-CoA dehydrogenase family protein [Dehalococcoidia bacterium]